MKKALAYTLSLALLLVSLTACHKPQADQQTDQSEPPQAATSTPATEPTSTPEPPAQNTSEPQKPTPEATEPVEVKEDEPDEVEPVAETTPPQEPTPTENKPATGGGGTTTTPPTSGGQHSTDNEGCPDPYEGLTPEEKEAILKELEERTQQSVDNTQGTMY